MKKATTFFIVMAATLSLAVAVEQTGPAIDDLLQRLSNDDSAAEAAGGLSKHPGDSRVLPALRARFQTATAKFTKQSIALALVKLNVEDPTYFNYLAAFASEAANDDAPFPYVLVGREPNYQSISPDFLKWCNDHATTVDEESKKEHLDQPRDIFLLASAADKRAAPILRKGLRSKNPLIVIYSASGLAALQDPSDIDQIIEAAYKSGVDIDAGVAMSLSSYKSPHDREEISKRLQGSQLYDQYIRSVKAEERRRATGNPKQ